MNKNKDTLKDLFNRLTLQEQNKVIDFAYLYDDIRGLRHQLQQKENIIKEVREYIENKVISNGEVIDQLRKIEVKELLEILDKGE